VPQSLVSEQVQPFFFYQQPARSRWKEYGIPALLLVVTAGSVYLHGGFELVGAALAIMLAHEMGHYVACLHYGVDATLPHFLPAPILSLVGTFGAFIRIRGPIPHRKALFDIGVAGPLAGFVMCLPILYLAAHEIQPVAPDPGPQTLELNEPLAFQLAVRFFTPSPELPPGMVYGIGAYGLAAWFGLFLTALNLMPVGQLDGGHVVYALVRRKAWRISRIASWACVALVYLSPTWLLWALLLRVLGRPHQPTLDDEAPVGRARVWVGILAAVVFVLCFLTRPVSISWADLLGDLSSLIG
jgi:membrane-associated protease RseP (regulator of RpoE activity)